MWLVDRRAPRILARQFAADGATVSRPALLSPLAQADGDPAVILLDRHVTRVHPNGLADAFVQRIVHLRTERAARDNQEVLVRYVPGEQEVEIREARIFRRTAAGEVEVSQASGRDDRDLSEPWYGLYYDARAEVVSFENLRAGDVIEVQYTVADVALQNDMADYFRRACPDCRRVAQADLGLHPHRAGAALVPLQPAALAGTRTPGGTPGERGGLSLGGHRCGTRRHRAGHARVDRDRALPAHQHLPELAGGGPLVLEPGEGPVAE